MTGKAVSLEIFGSDTLSPRSIASGRIVLGFSLLGCLSFPTNKTKELQKIKLHRKEFSFFMAKLNDFTYILITKAEF